ncbi:MAG: type II toxin-antitoxin system VapC family toxin [Nanoarchaeota archaeon]
MAVYLDSNILIFAFVNKDEKGERARALFDKIVRGQLDAMTSHLTFDEVFYQISQTSGREKAMSATQAALEIRHLRFLDADGTVIRKAHELLGKYNLSPRDAIHAASAILNGASSIITDDKDFEEVTEIKWEKLI